MTRSHDRAGETTRLREIWERTAPQYDRQIRFFERVLFEGGREWACGRAHGEVLEIGVGTGRNVRFYPPDVRLTGVDLSRATLEIAVGRVRRAGRRVNLVEANAHHLPFADERFDAAVSTLTMCSIPDYRRALAEAYRVLRPGGWFLLLEHVRSTNPLVRGGQRLLNPLAVRFQGDHLLRDPAPAVREAGFAVEEIERLKAGIVERIAARKPQ